MTTSTNNDQVFDGASKGQIQDSIVPDGGSSVSESRWEKFWYPISKFIANNQIVICISFGMLGFVFAAWLIVSPSSKSSKAYGEVILENRSELVIGLLTKRLEVFAQYRDSLNREQERLENVPKDATSDDQKRKLDTLSKMPAQRVVLEKATAATKKEKLLIDYLNPAINADYFLKYIHFDRNEFMENLHSKNDCSNTKFRETVDVLMFDDHELLKNGPISYRDELILVQNTSESLTAFVGDHPEFGLWMVFTIGQMMLWFLLAPLLSANMLSLKIPLEDNVYNIRMKDRLVHTLLPLIFIFIFCCFFYNGLADMNVIRDDFFMSGYSSKMKIYAVPGYLISSFCFTSFLTMAKHFDTLNKQEEDGAVVTTTEEFARKFIAIRKAFNNSFTCSAIILSLFVFWAGLLIYSLNSTQAFQFYFRATGKQILPSDFVYLMGLLHTLILLTFYIPIKLKFNTLKIAQSQTLTDSSVPDKRPIEALMASLGSVLINVSPILAALIQHMVNIFIQPGSGT